MKTQTRTLILVSLNCLTLFFSCKKAGIEEKTIEPAPQTYKAILIRPDSTVSIPVTDVKQIIPFHQPEKQVNMSEVRMLQVEACNGGLRTTARNGLSYSFEAIACFSAITYDWYLLRDGTVIEYLGTTGENQGGIQFTRTVTCGSLYTVRVRGVWYDPTLGGYVEIFEELGTVFATTPFSISGVGDAAQGADVKITDIDGNGIPDVVFMAYDNASGPNTFRYKIAYNMDAYGNSPYITGYKEVPGVSNEGEGAGLAFGDIDRNGVLDMVLMAYDSPSGPNSFRYKIGFNLNGNGDAAYWSGYTQIAGTNNEAQGAGVALYDVDKNGILDMVLMANDNPTGTNRFQYKVGFNLNTSGQTSNWTGTQNIGIFPGIGNEAQGAGMDIVDYNGDGDPEIFLMAYDNGSGLNTFRYMLAGLNTNGTSGSNSEIYVYLGVGNEAQGAGIAIGDIDRNGRADMILMANDNPSGPNSFRYYLGYDLISGTHPHKPSRFSCN